MKLSTYLSEENLTLDEFAKRIDRSIATVSRLARGKNAPDWETLRRISHTTNGAVTPNDFFETGDAA
tara:strand:- start:1128 stop:1328 length:201 start_codon:yes stop_codon:yes gene_type:complete